VESEFAALMPYRLAADVLEELIDRTNDPHGYGPFQRFTNTVDVGEETHSRNVGPEIPGSYSVKRDR
jgi:hypothetical protein